MLFWKKVVQLHSAYTLPKEHEGYSKILYWRMKASAYTSQEEGREEKGREEEKENIWDG